MKVGDKVRVLKSDYPREYKEGDVVIITEICNTRSKKFDIGIRHPHEDPDYQKTYHYISSTYLGKPVRRIVDILNER